MLSLWPGEGRRVLPNTADNTRTNGHRRGVDGPNHQGIPLDVTLLTHTRLSLNTFLDGTNMIWQSDVFVIIVSDVI